MFKTNAIHFSACKTISPIPEPDEVSAEGTMDVETYEPHYVVDNTGLGNPFILYYPWCFIPDLSLEPYVQLKFNEPVWLTHMKTRGDFSYNRERKGYVTNISVQHADVSMDAFTTYTDLYGSVS